VVEYGLTLSSEEHGPNRLVELAVLAEHHGFDFVSISDHFHPWLRTQGHSPFVWSVLGALSQVTEQIGVAVGVTCPTVRIHPAILAQATATTSLLLGDRFTWGVGTGEALNEQVLGDPWPPADIRLEMLVEAVAIVRALWDGDSVTHRGVHYLVEDATIFDPPADPPPIVVSAFGPNAADTAAEIGDGLWTSSSDPSIIERFRGSGGTGPVYAQLTVCWAADREKAIDIAHEVWPTTAVVGQLKQDLRTPAHFEQAVVNITREMVEETIPCGPDPDAFLDAVARARDAGVDHLYFHQIGDDQEGFLSFWDDEIAPALDRDR
jgi:coenzyme F420-dependent glucose-6-phosphate dehydrogenase